MSDDNIIIGIDLDSSSIDQTIKDIKNKSKDLGNSFFNDIDLKSIGIALSKTIGVAIAAGAAIAGVITKKSIDAAAEYDDTVNKLNVALASTGQFSKQASDNFITFAESIQKTTKFSDDQVISTAALIQNIARLTNDGLKRATQASLDLSSALGIDLQTASELVAKSANGNISAFARYGIEVRKGVNDTQTFANVLNTLESRFKGAANASANTFVGSIDKLKNSFDDIFKEIGKAIVRSPSISILINKISTIFTAIANGVKSSIGGIDFFKDLITNFSIVAAGGIETARRIGLSFELAFQRAQQAWTVFKIATSLGLSNAFYDQLIAINEKIDETKKAFSEESAPTKFFNNLIESIGYTNGKLDELTNKVINIKPSLDLATVGINDITTALSTGFTSAIDYSGLKIDDLVGRSQKAKETMIADFVAIGTNARNALGNSIGAGFAAFGKSLAQGENALEAFGKAFISSIGQAAISEGTALILRGIGYSFDPFLAGFAPGMIAAGAALATFGGALTAVGGGGVSSSAGSGGGGGSLTNPTVDNNEAPAIQEKTTQVKIDVQGTVLSPIEVGKQIAEILNDTFSATGTKVVTA